MSKTSLKQEWGESVLSGEREQRLGIARPGFFFHRLKADVAFLGGFFVVVLVNKLHITVLFFNYSQRRFHSRLKDAQSPKFWLTRCHTTSSKVVWQSNCEFCGDTLSKYMWSFGRDTLSGIRFYIRKLHRISAANLNNFPQSQNQLCRTKRKRN